MAMEAAGSAALLLEAAEAEAVAATPGLVAAKPGDKPEPGAKPAPAAKVAKPAKDAKPAKAAPKGEAKGKAKGKGKAKARATGKARAAGTEKAAGKRKAPEPAGPASTPTLEETEVLSASGGETKTGEEDSQISPRDAASAITAGLKAGNCNPLAKKLFPEGESRVECPKRPALALVKREHPSPGPSVPVTATTGSLDYGEVRKMLGQLKDRAGKDGHDQQAAAVKALEVYGSMRGQDKVHFLATYMEYKKGGKKLSEWAFSYNQTIQSGNKNELGTREDYCTRPCSQFSIIWRQKVSLRLLLIITTHASSLLFTLICPSLEMSYGRRMTILLIHF